MSSSRVPAECSISLSISWASTARATSSNGDRPASLPATPLSLRSIDPPPPPPVPAPESNPNWGPPPRMDGAEGGGVRMGALVSSYCLRKGRPSRRSSW